MLALPLCDRCLEPSRSCRGAQRRRASAGRARPLAATGGLEAHVQLCMWGIAVQEGCKIEEKPTLKYSAKQTTQYIYIYIQEPRACPGSHTEMLYRWRGLGGGWEGGLGGGWEGGWEGGWRRLEEVGGGLNKTVP